MKRILFALFFIPSLLNADPWFNAVSRNAGNYPETYSVTSTTSTATECVDDATAIKAANIDIYNNSAFTIWVGSNTTTLQTTGFPIKSSQTYTLDGTYTGSLYCTSDSAAAGDTNVRTAYYLKNSYR